MSTTTPVARRSETPARHQDLALWPCLVHVSLDMVVGAAAGLVVLCLLTCAAVLSVFFLVGLLLLPVTFAVSRGIASFERARMQALLGRHIPTPTATSWPSFLARLRGEMTSPTQWRFVAYSVALGITGPIAGAVVTAVWGIAGALLALPFYLRFLPAHGIVRSGGGLTVAAWMVVGAVALLIAPALTRSVASFDVVLASRLLGPGRTAQLQDRVQDLTRTRSAVVDAADAERRRIERDLHDGAQQRLVALAMNLGRARGRLDDDPAAARELVEQAHDDAKQALSELRNLARGLHPAVLADRGLDAALSALAARSPVPVALDVDVSTRCSPSIEAVAYFVVSESLTNIAKHARASAVTVSVAQESATLRLQVVDDGQGGADVAGGTGLAGLRDRVAAVDGTLTLSSPLGGPTSVQVELPCGS